MLGSSQFALSWSNEATSYLQASKELFGTHKGSNLSQNSLECSIQTPYTSMYNMTLELSKTLLISHVFHPLCRDVWVSLDFSEIFHTLPLVVNCSWLQEVPKVSCSLVQAQGRVIGAGCDTRDIYFYGFWCKMIRRCSQLFFSFSNMR